MQIKGNSELGQKHLEVGGGVGVGSGVCRSQGTEEKKDNNKSTKW